MSRHLSISEDLKLPPDTVTQTIAILARKGAGKTYTGNVLAEEMAACGIRFVVIDGMGVWWGLRAGANGDPKGGIPVVIFGGLHADVPLQPTMGAAVADFIIETRASFILDVNEFDSKAEQARFVQEFMDRLFRKNRDPLHLFLEEADEWAPQRPVHEEIRCLGAVKRVVRRGRSRGLGVTLITQRPASLSKEVLTQAEVLVALQVTGPQDRDAIDEWVKYHGDQERRKQFLADLAGLAVGTAYVWSPGWLRIFEKVRIRQRRTYDASSTPTLRGRSGKPRALVEVDLDVVKARFQAAVEKHKQDDPRELKRTIADLQKQLAARGREKCAVSKVEEMPVIRPKDFLRLERALVRAEKLEKKLGDLQQRVADLQGKMMGPVPELVTTLRSLVRGGPGPIQQPARASPRPVVKPSQAAPVGVAPAPPSSPGPAAAPASDGPLPEGEKVVLTAIAQHMGGVDRKQLLVLTGYKRSTRDSYIQRLRGRGFVQLDGDNLLITEAGIEALGTDYKPLPAGDALLRHWLGELPDGERRVLEVVVAAWPNGVARESIDEATGYARSSRDSYIQRLKARGLVVVRSDGIEASKNLFNGA